MNKTKINWCDYTWNPITGCSKIAQGCKYCYAESMANRFWGDRKFTDIQFHEERLSDTKFRSKKSMRVFVNSMSDLFHESIPVETITKIYQVFIDNYNQHTFLVLTKRIKRAMSIHNHLLDYFFGNQSVDNLPNLWIGYSASTQKDLDAGIDYLKNTDAKVKWLSLEPLIEPVNIYKVDWIVIGCESGNKRREFNNSWAREIIIEATNFNIPIWVKQIRNKDNKVIEDINLFPIELQLRELPFISTPEACPMNGVVFKP